MNFNDFMDDAKDNLWTSAADWFRASLPKPPGTPEPAPPAALTIPAISVPAAIDTKTVLMVGGAVFAGLALFLVLGKKGKK